MFRTAGDVYRFIGEFNGTKISQNNKLLPFNFFHKLYRKSPAVFEFEERMVGMLKHPLDYMTALHVVVRVKPSNYTHIFKTIMDQGIPIFMYNSLKDFQNKKP